MPSIMSIVIFCLPTLGLYPAFRASTLGTVSGWRLVLLAVIGCLLAAGVAGLLLDLSRVLEPLPVLHTVLVALAAIITLASLLVIGRETWRMLKIGR